MYDESKEFDYCGYIYEIMPDGDLWGLYVYSPIDSDVIFCEGGFLDISVASFAAKSFIDNYISSI